MKPIRPREDPIYGDYPALYALGIETPVRLPRQQGRPMCEVAS